MSSIPQFPTSKAAALADVSPDTLRRYADTGIVTPVRDAIGRRLFSESDITRAREHRHQTKNAGSARSGS